MNAQTTAENIPNPFTSFESEPPPAASSNVDAAERLRDAASDKIRRLRDAAEAGLRSYRENSNAAPDPAERSSENWEQLRAKLKDLHREGEAWARENPTSAMLAAAGAGFVLGLLLKR